MRGKSAHMIITDDPIDTSKMIFVFGSNEAGRHGAGAALYAREKKGAVYGQGYGLWGQSFAIPTKDVQVRTLPIAAVHIYVARFIAYAKEHPELTFQVTQIGCGLAGLKPEQIAPMFADAPDNCWFDRAWAPWLNKKLGGYHYWGTA